MGGLMNIQDEQAAMDAIFAPEEPVYEAEYLHTLKTEALEALRMRLNEDDRNLLDAVIVVWMYAEAVEQGSVPHFLNEAIAETHALAVQAAKEWGEVDE